MGRAYVVDLIDGCTGPSDEATVEVAFEVLVGAQKRYDIGFSLRPMEGTRSPAVAFGSSFRAR